MTLTIVIIFAVGSTVVYLYDSRPGSCQCGDRGRQADHVVCRRVRRPVFGSAETWLLSHESVTCGPPVELPALESDEGGTLAGARIAGSR